jgi:predicted ribonuclease YlaK
MASKYADKSPRWKWLHERGFNLHADPLQLAYYTDLIKPAEELPIMFNDSPAGTGKTTLAVLAGIQEVEAGNYDYILYARNAVPIREQGFLPGTAEEKEAPYMQPLTQAMDKAQAGLYERWVEQEKVVTVTTSHQRGVNWERAYVIIDEAQSFDMEELQAMLTRPDANCKVVVIGSTLQIDNKKLRRVAGMTPFEIMTLHFLKHSDVPTATHRLETNYRGPVSLHADRVGETINRLQKGSIVPE